MAPKTKHPVVPGQQFGHLTVVREARIQGPVRTRRGALVSCACGSESIVVFQSLLTGNTSSCGCQNPRTPSSWGPALWDEKPSGCWEWTGRLNSDGYGMFAANTRAHRRSLEIKLGRELEPEENALHTCDNPPCMNPDHLFVGSQRDNMLDMTAKGRHWSQKEAHV